MAVPEILSDVQELWLLQLWQRSTSQAISPIQGPFAWLASTCWGNLDHKALHLRALVHSSPGCVNSLQCGIWILILPQSTCLLFSTTGFFYLANYGQQHHRGVFRAAATRRQIFAKQSITGLGKGKVLSDSSVSIDGQRDPQLCRTWKEYYLLQCYTGYRSGSIPKHHHHHHHQD